ncbi:hypothetical protein SO802_018080 [Lithocarpus litseifolius]|uniref:Uncharacterized protein n=1 Tax=Lithocarpus litseifolius TaxID=425828 RepID=A0AAW2CM57_9ROSI
MMNRLFKSNSSTSLCSRSSSLPEIPQENGIINSEEYELSDLDLKLGDWNIPTVSTNEIYRSSWNLKKVFKTNYHVRTIEQVYGFRKPYETCYLFTSEKIKAHRKQGHKFLHIGLVQVGVKPLIREGLNSSILLALRDTRHIRFNDSLLGTIETTLSGGLVHFNCFSNFTIDLHDEHIMKIQNPDQNPDLDFVQQLANGSVRLSFDQSRFKTPLHDYRPRSPIDLQPIHTPRQHSIFLKDKPASQCSSSRPLVPFPRSRRDLGPELQGVRTRSQVSTPCYTTKQDSVVDQDDDNSQKIESPSGPDMDDPHQDFDLKVLRRDFELDMDALGKEFDLEKNRVKREAYKANHTRE